MSLPTITTINQNVRRFILQIYGYVSRGHEIDVPKFGEMSGWYRNEESRGEQVAKYMPLFVLVSNFSYECNGFKNLIWNTHSRIVPFLHGEMAAG